MFVRLIKLKESKNPKHPNNIEEGRVETGFMSSGPEVGKCFVISNASTYFKTSVVKKIIDENTFETMNSVYKIEMNDKINEVSG